MIQRFAVYLCLLVPWILAAQSANVASIRILAINSEGTDLYYLDYEGEYQSLQIRPYSLTRHYPFAIEGERINLYQKSFVGGKEVYESVAWGSVKRSGGEYTALLRSSPGKWDIELMDDAFKMEGECQLRLVNTLPVQVMLKIGKSVVEVEPGGMDLIPVEHKSARPVVGIIAVYQRAGGEWEKFFSSPKVILPNSRMTAVAMVREDETDASQFEIDLFTYSDRRSVVQR
jgi:hypothetical protein